MPNFIREEHRNFFLEVKQVKSYMAQHSAKGCLDTTCKGILHDIPDDLVFHNEQYTYGHLVVVRDGVYDSKPSARFNDKHECEWPSNYNMLYETKPKATFTQLDKVALFVGPQATYFQHFMDRLMPDIAQAWELVSLDTSWALVGPVGNSSKIHHQIWNHVFHNHSHQLGWGSKIVAKQMLYACKVPRFHPWIWQRMREIIGGKDHPHFFPTSPLSPQLWMFHFTIAPR